MKMNILLARVHWKLKQPLLPILLIIMCLGTTASFLSMTKLSINGDVMANQILFQLTCPAVVSDLGKDSDLLMSQQVRNETGVQPWKCNRKRPIPPKRKLCNPSSVLSAACGPLILSFQGWMFWLEYKLRKPKWAVLLGRCHAKLPIALLRATIFRSSQVGQ